MAARNVTDPDVWWHLKTGEYIAEHQSVPHADPFSYTRAGQPWVAHEWLTELLLYELGRSAGFAGLIIVFAAVLCAAFFLLYLRCGSTPYVAGVATLFAAWATMPVWGVRPQVLSLLLSSLWLLILERSERNPKILWWTLPLTLLWVNLHAGFALGLALSVLFLTGDLVDRVLGRSRQNVSHLRTAALVLLLDVLIVPLNPNGFRMYSYPVETLRSAAMQNFIVEWASPNFHHPEYWPFLLIVICTFAVLIWSRRPARPRDVLLLLVGLYAGLGSIRMMPLFVLIAIPIICKRVGGFSTSHSQPARPKPACDSLPERRHRAGDSCLCRRPYRSRDPAPAPGRDGTLPCPSRGAASDPSAFHTHLQPLRLGRLSNLEALSRYSRLHRRSGRSLWGETARGESAGSVRRHLSVQRPGAADAAAMENRLGTGSGRFRPRDWFAEFCRLDRRLRGLSGRDPHRAFCNHTGGNGTVVTVVRKKIAPPGILRVIMRVNSSE